MKLQKRYWDSACFLAWLKAEPEADMCKGTLISAENGYIQLVTAAITLTEVIKLKGKERIHKEDAVKISSFFQNNYIRVYNVDRVIAEQARDLIWDYSFMNPKDAIHVATAVRLGISVFDTFDKDLINLDGKIGTPALRIGAPDIPFQEGFFDPATFGNEPE